jgi:hypothetical protein
MGGCFKNNKMFRYSTLAPGQKVDDHILQVNVLHPADPQVTHWEVYEDADESPFVSDSLLLTHSIPFLSLGMSSAINQYQQLLFAD